MTEIELERLTTITMTEGEVYKLNLGCGHRTCGGHYICISNNTDANIWVSDAEAVPEGGSIVIKAGNAYNDLFVSGYVYVKAEAAGCISIVRKG